MVWAEAQRRRGSRGARQLYVTVPKPLVFPSEELPEEHVSETTRHLEARTTLYLLLRDALPGAAVGSDQFVYPDASNPRRCLSPDVFVKLDAREASFDNWKIWERGAPDVAVEIVSASDRGEAEWAVKLDRYQASGIAEVVRFDAEDEEHPLRLWDRVEDTLLERAPEGSELSACTALGLWWVVAPSGFGPMLRLARDQEGTQLLPTPGEERMRLTEALAEERKARTVAEHERMLEQDARKVAEDKLLAAEHELEKLRAELARARALR